MKPTATRIARYCTWSFCAAGLLWLGWLAVKLDVDEEIHENIQTVPVVGKVLNELTAFGPVYANFRTHPHGRTTGILTGHCSQEAFWEIKTNWNMDPLEMDSEMSKHFLEMVPANNRPGIIPSDFDIGGVHGSRMIGEREVRLQGAYFPNGERYILKVQTSY
ncbi:hypothetical protein Pan258_02800 [Symmachiella dynata]|nr:hypothetical protein Pan258_02800 [Symmachiella dynata]